MVPLTNNPQQVANLRLIFIYHPSTCAGSHLDELGDVTWIRFLCLLRSAMILQLGSSDVREAAHARGEISRD